MLYLIWQHVIKDGIGREQHEMPIQYKAKSQLHLDAVIRSEDDMDDVSVPSEQG